MHRTFVPPLLALLLALPVSAGRTQSAGARNTFESHTATFCEPPTCNCTSGPATLSVCHQKEITLEIGGEPVVLSTGFKTASCTGVTIAPGKCVKWCYDYRYYTVKGFFGSTTYAVLLSRTLTEEDASCSSASAAGPLAERARRA